MTLSALIFWSLVATSQVVITSGDGPMNAKELEDQRATYKQLWDAELTVRLEDLPQSGSVPEYRVPYSGHDYPDKIGGTLPVMSKYDRAFYRGQSKAYQAEREDLDFHTTVKTEGPERVRRGLFGRILGPSNGPSVVPVWYGHCNGWTAASIRHAEPKKSVTRNGVVFTPADIKGLLAEVYMYSHTQSLGGDDKDPLNPATLHIALANWLGKKSHPVAMETALGEPVINFPIYSYKSTPTKLSPNRYDVKTLVTYTLHVPRELDKGPKSNRQLYFHYTLDLDSKGNIVAGQYQRDSGRIDMVWVPLQVVQGGQEGNRGGNPHLDIKEVLAIWKESVDPDVLKKWVNVDPTEEERLLVKSDLPKPPMTDDAEKPAAAKPEAAPAVNTPAATTAPATEAPAAPATDPAPQQ